MQVPDKLRHLVCRGVELRMAEDFRRVWYRDKTSSEAAPTRSTRDSESHFDVTQEELIADTRARLPDIGWWPLLLLEEARNKSKFSLTREIS